jgi:hypothetical protein
MAETFAPEILLDTVAAAFMACTDGSYRAGKRVRVHNADEIMAEIGTGFS